MSTEGEKKFPNIFFNRIRHFLEVSSRIGEPYVTLGK